MRAECSCLIVYIVLWNCGATIFMVFCSDSTTATIQLSLPLFRPVGCHPLCRGAGSLFCILKPAAFSSFFIMLFFICYFHCSCDMCSWVYINLYMHLINVYYICSQVFTYRSSLSLLISIAQPLFSVDAIHSVKENFRKVVKT